MGAVRMPRGGAAAKVGTPNPVRSKAKIGRKCVESDTLPVLLVTGFLGAGKTTIVNSLLRGRGSLRVAVFVNEFGEVDVDGAVLRQRGKINRDRVLTLRNGCMCCSGNDDLEVVLREEFNDAQKELDLLIIETSGVTDPRPVLATLEAIPGLSVDRVVCVVDATTVGNVTFGASDGARPQISYADVLVLSKVDLLSTQQIDLAEKSLLTQRGATCSALPNPTIVRASNGALNLAALCSITPGAKRADSCGGAFKRRRVSPAEVLAASAHEELARHTFFTAYPVDRQRFEAWAAALPGDLLRAKGLLQVKGEKHQMLWHWAGGRSSALESVDSNDCKDPGCSREKEIHPVRGCEIVLIGRYGEPGWNPQVFDESLRHCVADGKG